ncbi:hypothetical protein EYF80_064000 [Liparis tanakae]|uniref:Uncharacterized protein n=1 Tax=Liparis tanakae TaxID=230148 RepID=A0A4Z2EAF9_9TELE|nr:hypothetical protein EYF80_064000 [Liparis tanakae]
MDLQKANEEKQALTKTKYIIKPVREVFKHEDLVLKDTLRTLEMELTVAKEEKQVFTERNQTLEMDLQKANEEYQALKTVRQVFKHENLVLKEKLRTLELKLSVLQDENQNGVGPLKKELQLMKEDNELLEEICLRQKQKNRGFFGKRMAGREIELAKMRSKIHEPETGLFNWLPRRAD